MGAKGALTYVLADKSGIRLWHTFGRLNIQILRSALPANTVSQWVEKLYEMINVEKVDSLEWFTPFIDSNAYYWYSHTKPYTIFECTAATCNRDGGILNLW